uniref:Tyrosinase_Cu-bd domain-containing protein n=1 Tax=Globodera pallida TaxID=36090 RepID=A0A183BN42_GLOPA
MVAQIWAEEGRKAKAEGNNIVLPEDLPPPSSGIGLPCFRAATHAEQQAQPPPKVVAERYACLNMTCLCPFFGGVALAADHCTLNGAVAAASSSATASRPRRQSGTPNLSLGRAVRMEYRMLSDNQRARFHAALQQLKRGFGSYEYDRITFLHSSISMMPSAHGGPTFLLWHREYVKRAVRMEYRMLSDNQRARFHAALQQLKRGFGSYEYDRITFLHSSISMMPSAHGGPTFLLWHREYVKRLEIALRAVDPSVAVPYWDSALDGRLPNPADSIMWSNLFMGTPSGSGTIADGPLASWVTPSGGPIRRQLGGAGALFTEQQIAALIRTPQISQILAFTSQRGAGCTAPAPNPSNVLEFSHNNVHMWVGGDMGPLTTSPQDPVFFMHHSFVDYIFEQWRQLNQNRQQRETQYPDDAQIVACSGSANYRLGATMLPFQDPVMLNGAALSNSYTDNLYTYAPRPTCRAAGGCGSAYLFCDVISGGGPLCCAKIRPGGDCSRFASNAEQPCFSSTCVNGRVLVAGLFKK